ncbi:UNVERIFIED_CONTAM: hypothetical protein K2H54_042918 [Gekko kuhli]
MIESCNCGNDRTFCTGSTVWAKEENTPSLSVNNWGFFHAFFFFFYKRHYSSSKMVNNQMLLCLVINRSDVILLAFLLNWYLSEKMEGCYLTILGNTGCIADKKPLKS